jgi:hypothetical protein
MNGACKRLQMSQFYAWNEVFLAAAEHFPSLPLTGIGGWYYQIEG